MSTSGLMTGKRGLIMGVANDRSIAWGIAEALHKAGAEIAFTYQGDVFKKRVTPLVAKLDPNAMLIDCDVSEQGSIDACFAQLKDKWGALDFVVHSIGFSDKEQLKGRYIDTTPDNFQMTMNISCYSFTAVAQRAEKMMPNGGSLLTLTYYGSERVMPHYNVMGVAKAALEASMRYMAEDLGKKGIRVNAVSAGRSRRWPPAASAISAISRSGTSTTRRCAHVTIEEVGNASLFLLSELGAAITGETLHVDAGYHIVGMKAVDAPDIAVVKSE